MTTQDKLTNALTQFNPSYLNLENESHAHAGYFDGKQSHFKLTIVSHHFQGLKSVARHQQIYALAKPFLMANGGSIHALAIHAYTPEEWQRISTPPQSPVCASQRF